MKERNPLLRAALAYAARLGWPVFPIHPRAKNPLSAHGHKDATIDEQIIREWWGKHPNANIGVPTGVKFWVLDIDPRHGGDESLEALVVRHTALTDTIQQMTGGGGKQYFWALPREGKIGCHTGVWPGIDIKGEGGYVLLPPSIHPSGKPYVWDTARRSILEETISPANPWLMVELRAVANHHSGEPFNLPARIPKGKQHSTLFKMGCAMRNKGCSEAEILAALWEVNEKRCEEPGPRAHIEKLAADISRRYAAAPRPAPKAKPPETKEATAIYDADYPDPEPIVEPILYPGLTILGGRPKVGKSWLALQLAIAVANQEKLAQYLEAKKTCRVLYVSLEDRERQIRYRLRRLAQDKRKLVKLRFLFELGPLMAGGAVTLDSELAARPVDVLIIDSLLAIVKQAKRANLDAMQADYNIVTTLRELGEKHSLALVLVAHTRKAAGEFLDSIQGTSGTTAAADAVWVLKRTPEGEAMLSVTGREVADNVFGLKRIQDAAWTITGEGDEITQSEARKDILELLRDQGPMKVSKIAQQLRKAISGTHRLLNALCDSGHVVRTDHGTYANTQTLNPNRKDGKEEHVQ